VIDTYNTMLHYFDSLSYTFLCVVAGSLSFGPETDGDILVNLRGRFADAFKLLFVIHLLL
jgi:hypothetical protein